MMARVGDESMEEALTVRFPGEIQHMLNRTPEE